jgi:hypothetical protein
LVCTTFHGDPPGPGYHAAHANGDSLDNRAENLSWKTPKENEADKIAHGTSNRGDRQWNSKLTLEKVIRIREEYAKGGVTQRDIAVKYGISQPTVSEIVNRRKWAWA